MLHNVQDLVVNWVSVLFGDEQVVYCGVLELYLLLLKTAVVENDTMRAARENQNSEVQGHKAKVS